MMELRDTVELMVSDDYEERFRAEYRQLHIRCSKLRQLLCDWGAGRLDFEPTCSRELLERQYRSMNKCLVALKELALIEHIDLGIEHCAGKEER